MTDRLEEPLIYQHTETRIAKNLRQKSEQERSKSFGSDVPSWTEQPFLRTFSKSRGTAYSARDASYCQALPGALEPWPGESRSPSSGSQTMQQPTTRQDYGNDPLAVRDSEKYREEYIETFVDKWDELIDWDGRASAEGHFFIDQLRERGAKKVLDVATGTGFHSVQLLEAGFEVTSADGSPVMLAKAFENARRRGHILRTVHADWRCGCCGLCASHDALASARHRWPC